MKKTYITPKSKNYQVSVCHPIATSGEQLVGGGEGGGLTPEARDMNILDPTTDNNDYIW